MIGILKSWLAANISTFLFIAGHLVSIIMHKADWSCPVTYPIYNNLMFWSSDLEQWAGISCMWNGEK